MSGTAVDRVFRLELADTSAAASRPILEQYTTSLAGLFEQVAGEFEVPPLEACIVVADDFSGAVQQAWRDSVCLADAANGEFSADRVGGGKAVAKTIDLSQDGSRFRIVVNASTLGPLDEPGDLLWTLFLLGHELTHTLLGRLRHASGALDGVSFPSQTPVEGARSTIRAAVDELRADMVANGVLASTSVTLTSPDGQTRPVQFTDLHPEGHRGQVAAVLDSVVHPGWPDTVDAYRMGELSLDELHHRILSQADQTFTLLAHAEAEAMMLQRPGALEDECREHPGAQLYLAEAWRRVMNALGDELIPVGLDGSVSTNCTCSMRAKPLCWPCGNGWDSPSTSTRTAPSTFTSLSLAGRCGWDAGEP